MAARREGPVDQHRTLSAKQDVSRMKVAMAEAVSIGQSVKDPNREVPQINRERFSFPYLLTKPVPGRRQCLGSYDLVELSVNGAQSRSDGQELPRLAIQHAQLIRAFNAVHDQPRSTRELYSPRHSRNGDTSRPCSTQRQLFPVQANDPSGIAVEPQYGATIPRIDLRLPALTEQLSPGRPTRPVFPTLAHDATLCLRVILLGGDSSANTPRPT